MIRYDEWTAEDRLYGNHRGGVLVHERPHPTDEKRAAERQRSAGWYCAAPGCEKRGHWTDEDTGLRYCEEHAQ